MKTKEELQRKSKYHLDAIESDFDAVVHEGKQTAKKVALVAGGVAVVFLLIKTFKSNKSPSYAEAPTRNAVYNEGQRSGIFSTIGKMLLTQAGVVAIGLAKSKIRNYVENLTNTDEHFEDPPR